MTTPNLPSVAGAERPTQVRWLVFALACAASWLLYLHRYSWGVLKPAFRRAHPELDDVDLGWLDSAFQASYALGQVPGGLLGDLFGPRAILSGSVVLWSAAAAGVVWAAGFWGLFAVRAAFGLAQAAAYPVLNKMTRNWFPLSVRTSVQGVVTALGRVGAACAPPLIATVLIGLLGFSWQGALTVLAAPGVLLGLAFWVVVRNSPREHPWTNPAECALVGGGPAAGAAAAPRAALTLNRGSVFSLSMLLVYAFASTFQDQLYVYWIPSFLVEGHNLDEATMGVFAPLPLLGGAVGGVLGGLLNDWLLRRTGNRRWARSGVAFTGKLIAAGLVLYSAHVGSGELAMVVLLTARVFGDWSLPTQWGAVTDMGGRAAGTLFGLVNTVGALGGFVAGPTLGWLKREYGWEGLFAGAAAMCLLAAVTWLFIDCTRRVVAD